jgi:hypothetical protein
MKNTVMVEMDLHKIIKKSLAGGVLLYVLAAMWFA